MGVRPCARCFRARGRGAGPPRTARAARRRRNRETEKCKVVFVSAARVSPPGVCGAGSGLLMYAVWNLLVIFSDCGLKFGCPRYSWTTDVQHLGRQLDMGVYMYMYKYK